MFTTMKSSSPRLKTSHARRCRHTCTLTEELLLEIDHSNGSIVLAINVQKFLASCNRDNAQSTIPHMMSVHYVLGARRCFTLSAWMKLMKKSCTLFTLSTRVITIHCELIFMNGVDTRKRCCEGTIQDPSQDPSREHVVTQHQLSLSCDNAILSLCFTPFGHFASQCAFTVSVMCPG